MRPLKISTKNIGPLKGSVSIDLSQVHATTISGANEAGKSTLIKSIKIALFGGKDLERLIYDLADEAEIDLTFSHGGEIYRILRTLRREKPQILKLWCGDKNISERLLSNTQQKLDDILKFSQKFLLSTAIAEQDEINKLSTMGPTEREQILSEMLSSEIWEEKKKAVGKILNEFKDVSKDIKEFELEIETHKEMLLNIQEQTYHVESELVVPITVKAQLEQTILEEDQKLKDYQEANKLITRKQVLQSKITTLQEQIQAAPLSKSPETLLAQIKKNQMTWDENKEIIKETNEGIEQIKKLQAENQGDLYQVEQFIRDSEHTQILQDVPCVGLEIHDTCKLLSSALKTKRTIEEYRKTKEDRPLSSIKSQLLEVKDSYAKDLKFLTESAASLQKEQYELLLQIDQDKATVKQLEKTILLQKDLDNLQTELGNLSPLVENIKPFDQANYQNLKQSLKTNTDTIQNLQIRYAKLESDQTNVLTLLSKSETKLEELKKIDNNLANYRTLHGAYTDIPPLLFEQAIPTLEEYTNEILEKVSPGKKVQLRSFRETKSETQEKALDVISNTATGTRDFGDLSGSAKFRQSLALRIALARYNRELNNIDIDFFLVDEGFGSLDTENTATMKLMLREIASHFDLFMMVSHVPELQDVFPNQIIVNSLGKGEKVTCVQKQS